MLDARPEQVLRVGGTSYVTIISALSLGAVFVALTFKWWIATMVAATVCFCAIVYWLWTGTAEIPEKAEKEVGVGLTLPLYTSGPPSVGWWAMFITMVGDSTAFASLVFGYFFYWTIHDDFTAGVIGPGMKWPLLSAALFVAAWLMVLMARHLNGRGSIILTRAVLAVGVVLAVVASTAGFAGPWQYGMDPRAHVYAAIVWLLTAWTLVHAATGAVMLAYCLARHFAGRLTKDHDMDIGNVALYWHFMAITAVVTFIVIGLFPEVL